MFVDVLPLRAAGHLVDALLLELVLHSVRLALHQVGGVEDLGEGGNEEERRYKPILVSRESCVNAPGERGRNGGRLISLYYYLRCLKVVLLEDSTRIYRDASCIWCLITSLSLSLSLIVPHIQTTHTRRAHTLYLLKYLSLRLTVCVSELMSFSFGLVSANPSPTNSSRNSVLMNLF